MPKRSAGLLMFRRKRGTLELFLVHPGGPFWRNKDAGAWSIPKGEYEEREDPLSAAQREFAEETSLTPHGDFIPLGEAQQAGGKFVKAWAFEGDCDPALINSNTFTMEWPPRSGKQVEFPEVDRAGWFAIADARGKILQGQLDLLDRLVEKLSP